MNKIVMPSGGQTTDETLIGKWHKKTGDRILKGDVLCEIETDKAVLNVESFCDGYLLGILYNEGEIARTGDVIAYIGEPGESVPGLPDEPSPGQTEEFGDGYATRDDVKGSRKGRVLASPLAKKLARDYNVDVSVISAGKSEVIKKQDVFEYLAAQTQYESSSAEYKDVPVSPMRAAIAGRMTESVTHIPQFTVSVSIDMTECIKLRERLNEYLAETGSVKLSYNDIIMKCSALAAERFPFVNASYMGGYIRIHKNVNIGLAVSVGDGLVVPVNRCTEQKPLTEISIKNAENIRKARENKLNPEDISGGTLTISNLGMMGVEWFTAIINPPQTCILAIGSICDQTVNFNGEFVFRKMMKVCASFDHRVIDGASGGGFLIELKKFLEKPWLMLLKI